MLWLKESSGVYAYSELKTREQCGSGIEVAKEMTKVRTGQATVLCLPDTVDPRGPRRK